MKYDGIIFDLDGTLWDASEVSARGWTKGFASMKLLFTATGSDIRTVSGKPFNECLGALFPEIGSEHPEAEDILDRFEREEFIRSGGALYDGISDAVITLSQTHKLFIVSNCQSWYLDAFISHSKLGTHFTFCDCFGKSRKIKSLMISEIAGKYRIKNAVYIGDTLSDEKAADDAGVDFIHAAYGFGKSSGSRLSIHSINQLYSLL